MTAKSNFKAQRKAAQKRKKRQQANAQQKHLQTVGKPRTKKIHPEYTEEFIHKYIKEHGFYRATIDLKLQPSNTEFSRKDVMEMISGAIPPIVGMHSAIEIFDILLEEGKAEIKESDLALLVEFDKLVVHFNEDVNAIIQLLQANVEIDTMMDLISDLTSVLMDITTEYQDPIFAILKPVAEQVDEYVREHSAEDETMHECMHKLHTQRMVKIFPLYATHRDLTAQPNVVAEEEVAVTEPAL